MLNMPLMLFPTLVDLNAAVTDLAMQATLDSAPDEPVIFTVVNDLEDDTPTHPERSGLWFPWA